MSAGVAGAELADGLRRLWQANREALLAATITIEDAVAAACAGPLDDETRKTAERTAHKLIGSAGAYGFVRAAVIARELEQQFASGLEGAAGVVVCAELVEELTAELDVDEPPAATTPELDAEDGERATTVLLVHPETRWRQAMAFAAADRGLAALHATTPSQACAMVRDSAPGVVVAHPGVLEDDAAWASFLDAVAEATLPPPIVALGDARDTADRVAASRRGVARFVDLDTDESDIVEVVVDVLGVERDDMPCVLAVDDDRNVLAQVRRLLTRRSYVVRTLSNPKRLWKTLDDVAPDVVVLDWEMPEVSGADLCRALRADPRWMGVPILVLTGHTDPDTLMAAFTAGADDFVAKPLVGPVLTGRIENRLERLRLLTDLADRDVLTGLLHRIAGHRKLDRMFERAGSNDDPVSVALIDVDRLGHIAREHGYDLSDRIVTKVAATLRHHFSAGDVMATWATGRFVVGMAGLPKAEAVQRAAELLELVRVEPLITTSGDQVPVTIKAGIAEYPADGESVDAIVNRADDAVAMARERGGDCVIPAGWDPDRDPRLVDVAIVEDDAQLAEILSHALTTRGVRTRWLRDGVEAVDALIGTATSPASVSPRVVLLDVNLPGMSGMAVLRRLAEAGGLERTKVVMLTARSAEHDVIAALSIGAVDHVAKPFSVPVLLERLRHHLHG